MKETDTLKKIVVLIDAENAQRSKLKDILEEISSYGHIITKRAYGDWASQYLKHWSSTLNELAIQPQQQFAFTQGKNSTDSAMIIDAMDLLYSKRFDTFVIVSSDSDFTRLAIRLKEAEIFVCGVGEMKTPSSFKNACDDFILTENLGEKEVKKKDKLHKKIEKLDKIEIVSILLKAFDKNEDNEGWCDVKDAGFYIKRVKADFDTRTYGYSKLSYLIRGLSEYFLVEIKEKGNGTIAVYQPTDKALRLEIK